MIFSSLKLLFSLICAGVLVDASSQAQPFLASQILRYKSSASGQGETYNSRLNKNLQASYDSGFFSPLEDMGLLSESEFTVLQHPAFEKYSVRIKKAPSSFCDSTVNQYTGYIDISEARHIFFYFFESREDPDTDDVIFWTNGGPGCSSSMGLFLEHGPCRITNGNGTYFHPESWNTNANVFYVDQPIGVGFSYAQYGEHVSTTEEAAADIAAFVVIFFEHFSKFKGRAFHMAGESYAGRYVPLFASAIYDQNAALVQAGLTPINLTSVIIGNGLTDFVALFSSYYDILCTPASHFPVLPISTCIRMKEATPRCTKWMTESCRNVFDKMNCLAAVQFCSTELMQPYYAAGGHPHDISIPCEGEPQDGCYTVTKYYEEYLSRPDVRKMLGVDPSTPANFSNCNDNVALDFNLSLDLYYQSYDYVANLLERGVNVLLFVGDYDFVCNWVVNERWSLDFDWSGKEQFASQKLVDWKMGGKTVGKTRSAKGLMFATIHGAGHLVPYDKPKEALELLQRWLAGKPL